MYLKDFEGMKIISFSKLDDLSVELLLQSEVGNHYTLAFDTEYNSKLEEAYPVISLKREVEEVVKKTIYDRIN